MPVISAEVEDVGEALFSRYQVVHTFNLNTEDMAIKRRLMDKGYFCTGRLSIDGIPYTTWNKYYDAVESTAGV